MNTSEDFSAEKYGFSAGQNLERFTDGKEFVAGTVLSTIEKMRENLHNEQIHIESKARQLKEKLSAKVHEYETLWEKDNTFSIHENKYPSEYSIPRGVLYVIFSLILFFADMAILGQVLARFLNLDWYSHGKTFNQILFTDFGKAVSEFPDLFALILTVLVIGLFYKVWSDLAKKEYSEDKSSSKYNVLNFRINLLFLVLSIITIILIAAIRLTMDVGSNSDNFSRIVSFFMGFTLPLVGAGFFIKGTDNLGNRYNQFKNKQKLKKIEKEKSKLSKELSELELEVQKITDRKNEIDNENYLKSRISRKQAEFSKAYYNGLLNLLKENDHIPISQKIKPLFIREYIS